MYLNYSELEFDRFGRPEIPELVLQTLSEDTIGILGHVSGLKIRVKFAEPSEIEFDIPSHTDGMKNPMYDHVTGRKIIYTKRYGIYVTMDPATNSDGISDTKHVKGYSIEKRLDDKRFFLEDGTFNFWNPAAPDDTILSRVTEIAPDWSIGYVSPSLVGRYRTFDSYDDYLLPFLYDTVTKKFRCVVVFDPYKKEISAYDADEERAVLPIYLDFDNLLESVDTEEISSELVTAIRPYGADGLDILAVNPTGSSWLYDLSYFISNGDIPDTLAQKWNAWQQLVLSKQEFYRGLIGMRSSATARLLAERAALTDLNGELTDLMNQQNVTIQALAMETTASGKQAQQEALDSINANISAKKHEIAEKEEAISALERGISGDDPSSYQSQIKAVVDELSITNYFTSDEYNTLRRYFVEQDMTDNSFVATDVGTSVSGISHSINSATVQIIGADIAEIDLTDDFGKQIYTIAGGTLSLAGEYETSCDIIRGTLEVGADGRCVLSTYAGRIVYGDKSAPSGMITVDAAIANLVTDISPVDMDGIMTYHGTSIQFDGTDGSMYMTVNVSEYQKYSVQMELFNYAAGVLKESAVPTYEFSVNSANFLFAKEFAPFREKLELGSGIYLNIGNGTIITPLIIELELDLEDQSNFSILFSNRFKRHDSVNTLKDMIESGYTAGRSFDASKYIYNRTVEKADQASKFMDGALDAAVNTIVGAANKTVEINGAGIQVGGDSNYQLRIVDNMIAMTDDGWKTAKLGVGLFATEETGQQWGFNGELVAGKLLVGNNLVLENQLYDENNQPTGVMQFKVDSTGAWLNNSTFVLQKDSGGRMILDPAYGLLAGSSTLFDTEGTTVKPSFIDSNGKIVLDEDGMPKDANFFLDIRDGNAYFRGKVFATDGVFNGDVYAKNGEFRGMVYAKGGEFDGIVKARDLQFPNGDSMTSILNDKGKIDANWLDLMGINVMNKAGETVMTIDENGLRFSKKYSPIAYQFSTSLSGPWHDTMAENDKYRRDSLDGGTTWGEPYQFKGTDGSDGSDANVNWSNIKRALSSAAALNESIITIDSVGAPNIYGGKIYGTEIYAGEGSNVFARVDGAGLNVFNDASEIPKVQIGVDGTFGQTPQIILGSGTGSSSGMNGRMYIVKQNKSAQILYSDSAGNQCGFSFDEGGIINPIGELNTTARFG